MPLNLHLRAFFVCPSTIKLFYGNLYHKSKFDMKSEPRHISEIIAKYLIGLKINTIDKPKITPKRANF